MNTDTQNPNENRVYDAQFKIPFNKKKQKFENVLREVMETKSDLTSLAANKMVKNTSRTADGFWLSKPYVLYFEMEDVPEPMTFKFKASEFLVDSLSIINHFGEMGEPGFFRELFFQTVSLYSHGRLNKDVYLKLLEAGDKREKVFKSNGAHTPWKLAVPLVQNALSQGPETPLYIQDIAAALLRLDMLENQVSGYKGIQYYEHADVQYHKENWTKTEGFEFLKVKTWERYKDISMLMHRCTSRILPREETGPDFIPMVEILKQK